MTPLRLVFMFEEWSRERRQRQGVETHWRDFAALFEVSEATVRRWRSGERPIPRSVELTLEIFHGFPEVTAEGVEALIAERDDEASSR